MDCTIRIAKTKALISFAVTAKLICVFVFAHARNRFSHNEAHIVLAYNVVNASHRRKYFDFTMAMKMKNKSNVQELVQSEPKFCAQHPNEKKKHFYKRTYRIHVLQ